MGDPDQTDNAAGDDDTIRNQTPPAVAAPAGQPEDVSAAQAPASDAAPAASSSTSAPAASSPTPAAASPQTSPAASPQTPASPQAPVARARAASAESHVRVDARLLEAALLNLRKRVAAVPLVFEIA
ncbi:MAG TPA: hypothetical protein VJ305_20300, partial [Streptosporangiaceae bacterium]|nr:hypothetical protein [Streptosporangiaceae bacterium]